jgi:DNA-binding MarR family transcriptional regulator
MLKTAEFSECRDCACLAARTEAQRLTRSFDAKLRPHDLTINQFSMLTTLILAGATPVSQLAARLGIDRTTMTRNVTRSEARGLVAAAPGKDARERLVAITPAGRALAEKALPAWRSAQQGALASRAT